jgi:hypothetical protein
LLDRIVTIDLLELDIRCEWWHDEGLHKEVDVIADLRRKVQSSWSARLMAAIERSAWKWLWHCLQLLR